MSSTYVIGDIHGCSDLLDRLLIAIEGVVLSEDTTVFLGDYIDGGVDSRGVVDLILAFRARHRNTVTLKGNHEQWMMEAWTDFARKSWLVGMGGLTTVRSYSMSGALSLERSMRNLGRAVLSARLDYGPFLDAIPAQHRRFFEGLRTAYEDEHGIYAHAGLDPSVAALADQSEHDLLWNSPDVQLATWRGPKTLVVGHLPTFQVQGGQRGWPLLTPHVILADVGANETGALCAVRLPDREVIRVSREQCSPA